MRQIKLSDGRLIPDASFPFLMAAAIDDLVLGLWSDHLQRERLPTFSRAIHSHEAQIWNANSKGCTCSLSHPIDLTAYSLRGLGPLSQRPMQHAVFLWQPLGVAQAKQHERHHMAVCQN